MISNNYETIQKSKILAYKIIPKMLLSNNLIYVNGTINGVKTKIIIDTGATSCIISKSFIDKCNLNYLVDDKSTAIIQDTSSINSTIGAIWFLEINLNTNNNNILKIPINAEIINDSKVLSESFELILGINFLKNYKVTINFSSMFLIFSKKNKILFYQ